MNVVAKFTGRALKRHELAGLRKFYTVQRDKEIDRRIRVKAKVRRLNKDLRADLVARVVNILKDGNPTFFALEGACRHNVRVYLCVEGWGWDEADRAAADIVSNALNRLGAQRPSWAQGQREYRGEEFHGTLKRCRNPRCRSILEEQQKLYCSPHCQELLYNQRYRAQNAEFLRTRAKLYRAKRREQDPETYAAIRKEADKRYRQKWPVRDCARCGKPFQGRPKQTFCSHKCARPTQDVSQKERACAFCFTRFFVRYAAVRQQTCSRACGARLAKYGRPTPPKPNNFKCEPVSVEKNP